MPIVSKRALEHGSVRDGLAKARYALIRGIPLQVLFEGWRKGGKAALEISQVYETTVADRISGHAVRFLVIPHRSLRAALRQEELIPATIASELDLQAFRSISAAELPQAIAGMLKADSNEMEVRQLQAQAVVDRVMQTASPPPEAATPDSEIMNFADHVAFSAMVPFEDSPLGLVSLASKAAALSKNGIALGAFIGVIAGGTTPLLLVTVPAGIILCASAIAFAKIVDTKRVDIFVSTLGIGTTQAAKQPTAPDAGNEEGDPSGRRRRSAPPPPDR